MSVCWNYEDSERPSFKTISYFFNHLQVLTTNSEKSNDFSVIRHFSDSLPYKLCINTESVIKI